MIKLTEFQQKVLGVFDKKNTDIDIAVLYQRVYGDPGHMNVRDMQQKIAPTFAVINEKMITGNKKTYMQIELGVTKRTYRLTKNKR